jgi:hypothetical protein
MSKKKFTNGLESLFFEGHDEEITMTMVEPTVAVREERMSSTRTVRKGGKDFSSDIDQVIIDSFVTNNDEKQRSGDADINYAHIKKPKRNSLGGLESLLTRTLEISDFDFETKRRIVLILEQAKVDRLKEIAKSEQSFLKDIITKSVSYYIDQYDRKRKG